MKFFLLRAAAALMCVLTLAGMAFFCDSTVAIEIDIIEVGADEISQNGFSAAVQSALDSARLTAGDGTPVTVRVSEGSYGLENSLHIYDNTILDLRGVTVTRLGLGNMIRVGDEDTVDTGVTGYYYRNITLLGGTFDGSAGKIR